jgi:diadenosine tetraphosphate (Ap4A) HIT family hydrolase
VPNGPCPFCTLPRERILVETDTAIAFFDGYPVTEGHTLIIPRRHVARLFDLPPAELHALWDLVARMHDSLQARFGPDGFNLGLNDGEAAGQTIGHAHVHLIPRRRGDVPDPRGGVRWIIPDKARYW